MIAGHVGASHADKVGGMTWKTLSLGIAAGETSALQEFWREAGRGPSRQPQG
jgi:hypothetical protein